jgi:hypothetical protein
MAMAMAMAMKARRSANLDDFSMTNRLRKLTIALLSALGAWILCSNALVALLRKANPDQALRYDSDDPIALTWRAERILAKGVMKSGPDLAAMSRRSLRSQALNARALRMVGLFGSRSPSFDLADLALKTSRRDTVSVIWLMERDIEKNDITAAVKKFDLALRISRGADALLFPRLNSALADREIRKAFLPFLANPPPWLESFLAFAVSQSGNPLPITETIMEAGGLPAQDLYRNIESQLLLQLAALGEYRAMWMFFDSLKTASKKLPESTAFNVATIDRRFAPVAWQLFPTAGIEASFEPGRRSRESKLLVVAGAGERGIVMRKLMRHDAGTYKITQSPVSQPEAGVGRSNWELKCARRPATQSIWRSDSAAAVENEVAEWVITIPANCDTQSLELNVIGGDGQMASTLTVGPIAIARAAFAPTPGR